MNSRTDTLNSLNEEIDQLKQQIEEQGTQNTSGGTIICLNKSIFLYANLAPILKIKQALNKLDKECFVMRVQIATLEQALMQTQLANRLDHTELDLLVNPLNY